jgi:uncharacterized membrane protein (DUF2068 family)
MHLASNGNQSPLPGQLQLVHVPRPPQKPHNRWLVLIAVFKLLQAALFIALAVGAFHYLQADLADELERLSHRLFFNPESKFVNLVLEKATHVDDRLLKEIGAVSLIYAGLDLLEGIGLYLEKVWAEYLTLLITGSFLPLEIYEIVRRVTPMRIGLFLANALVFFYLVKIVAGKARKSA